MSCRSMRQSIIKHEGTRLRRIMQDEEINVERQSRLQSVRRRLFQDDDKDGQTSGMEDNYMNSLYEEARKSRENAKRRWNFDFEKEEPLPGRYEWEKVDQNETQISDLTRSNGETKDFDSDDMEDQEMENLEESEETTMDDDKNDST